jgi:L-asparaginase
MSKIIIHGGCGAREAKHITFSNYHTHLASIIKEAYRVLKQSNHATYAALHATRLLEDDPLFNAGTGSKLQQDGKVRMSASIMDTRFQQFAGVINIQQIANPSSVAYHLMGHKHSVLSGEKARQYAHKSLGHKSYDPITSDRWQEFLEQQKGNTGTVGVVALDDENHLCALTSTGGSGYEKPGRVGDSPTIAGNFASEIMGIACTGIGEQIVNQAVAPKIHTRVKDGMALSKAVDQAINESNQIGDYAGFIQFYHNGEIKTGSTDVAQTLYAYCDGQNMSTFYQWLDQEA